MKKSKINIITLGCSKNLVDSQVLMRQLTANNIDIVHNAPNIDVDAVVINTCGFINDAKQESIDTIIEAIEAKKAGEVKHVFVFGCLSERYKQELETEIPEVDAYFGVNSMEQVIEKLKATTSNSLIYRADLLTDQVLTHPPHYAYLKVSEGCSRLCSFCAIPLIRGKHQSKPLEQLKLEAELLAQKGVKDLTYYGVDIYKEQKLAELINSLSTIKGIEWIRLHYAYPAMFPWDVIEVMKTQPKICHYLDIPFQHVSDRMLKLMRRGHDSKASYELIDKLRTTIPDIALRTTLLIGHPGETKQDFADLLKFVEFARFERLGVFTYSHEDGTYAATNMKDSVSNKEKQRRASEIMQVQQTISAELNQQKEGQTFRAIIDYEDKDYYFARTEYDSPEVDNEVLIPKSFGNLSVGKFYQVRITSSAEFDLYAEPLTSVNP